MILGQRAPLPGAYVPPSPSGKSLIQEDSTYFLLEDSSKILLEV